MNIFRIANLITSVLVGIISITFIKNTDIALLVAIIGIMVSSAFWAYISMHKQYS